MPRKKKVKITSSRPKAKIPDGDEGKDLEADIKQAKLETLLKDFDDTGALELDLDLEFSRSRSTLCLYSICNRF